MSTSRLVKKYYILKRNYNYRNYDIIIKKLKLPDVPVGIGFKISVYCSPCKTLAKLIERPGTSPETNNAKPPNAGITPKLERGANPSLFSYNKLIAIELSS